MTQIHPNILGARAALGDLEDQHQWLADLLEPGTRRARTTPRLTAATRALLNRQTRDERRDQVESMRKGLAPRGPSPAAVVLDVLHVQLVALDTVMDAAWRVTSALHTHPDGYPYRGGGSNDAQRFTAAASYLHHTLPLVHPELAGELGSVLHAVAKLAEQVTDHGPKRHDLEDACPACGDRFLTVTTWGTDDAVVTCTRRDCRCHGRDCGCKRPDRMPGRQHMWQASEFDQLLTRLREGEAA